MVRATGMIGSTTAAIGSGGTGVANVVAKDVPSGVRSVGLTDVPNAGKINDIGTGIADTGIKVPVIAATMTAGGSLLPPLR